MSEYIFEELTTTGEGEPLIVTAGREHVAMERFGTPCAPRGGWDENFPVLEHDADPCIYDRLYLTPRAENPTVVF